MIADMSHHNPIEGYQQSYVDPSHQYHYRGQIPELQIDNVQTQPWSFPQRPRSTQNVRSRRASPAASLYTTNTALHPRGLNRTNYHRANLSPLDSVAGSHMHRDFDLLDPAYVAPYYDTTASRGPEPAWSPYNLRASQLGNTHGLSDQSNVNFQFPCGPTSDVDSQAVPSDEGYGSRNTKSVMSNDPEHINQELPASLMSHIGNMRVESVASEAPTMSRMPSDQRSHVSSHSGRSRKELPCPECSDILKCNSEYKCVCGIIVRGHMLIYGDRKHMLKHSKPYKCDIPGCKRIEGFTTQNDLERHQKSLHRKDIDKKSYQCAVENCRNKEKIWPRLDNFKQHIERMHKCEDVHNLIQR